MFNLDKRLCLSWFLVLLSLEHKKVSGADDYNVLHRDGAYEFGYDNPDSFHHSQANRNNVVRGEFGSRNPGSGAIDTTQYTAGPRGFRPRGKNIVRKYDLNQNGPRPIGSRDDPYFDPNEDPSYNFAFRTRTYSRQEAANRVGDVNGKYSFLDDIGERHNVEYIAGKNTGFHVKTPFPDSNPRAYGPLYYNGRGKPIPRGRTSIQRGLDGSYKFISAGPDQRRTEVSDSTGHVRGSYTYLDDKGVQHSVHYIAGPETGYRVLKNVKGPHLPTIYPFSRPEIIPADFYDFPRPVDVFDTAATGHGKPTPGGGKPTRPNSSADDFNSDNGSNISGSGGDDFGKPGGSSDVNFGEDGFNSGPGGGTASSGTTGSGSSIPTNQPNFNGGTNKPFGGGGNKPFGGSKPSYDDDGFDDFDLFGATSSSPFKPPGGGNKPNTGINRPPGSTSGTPIGTDDGSYKPSGEDGSYRPDKNQGTFGRPTGPSGTSKPNYGETSNEVNDFNIFDVPGGSSKPSDGSSKPFGTTGGGLKPFGTAGSDTKPFGSTGGGSKPFGTTGGGSRPFGSAGGSSTASGGTDAGSRPFGGTDGGSRPFGTTGGSSRPSDDGSHIGISHVGSETSRPGEGSYNGGTIVTNVGDQLFSVPPGVSVRAHVQAIDLLPLGPRSPSPSEQLKADSEEELKSDTSNVNEKLNMDAVGGTNGTTVTVAPNDNSTKALAL